MAKITYLAPEDDSEVVTFMGLKLFSGQATEVDPAADAALLSKAVNNRFFKVEDWTPPAAKRGPGRPRKAEEDNAEPQDI